MRTLQKKNQMLHVSIKKGKRHGNQWDTLDRQHSNERQTDLSTLVYPQRNSGDLLPVEISRYNILIVH